MTLARSHLVDIALVVAAVALQIVPLPQSFIENVYANGFYAALARVLVPLSNHVPFSIGDVLFVAIVMGVIVYWVARLRRARGKRWSTVGSLVLRTASIVAVLTIWFDISWALNYRRVPIVARVAYDATRVNPQNVAAFSKRIIDDLNRTAPLAHAQPESAEAMQLALAQAYAPVVARVGDTWTVNVSRPKATIFQFWFAAAGIGGEFDPFAYETIVNADFLPYELPFALAHEWGHVAGFGDESDANLIAALTCLRSSDPLAHYSGLFWIYAWLPQSERRKTPLTVQVAADIKASRERFFRHYQPQLYSLQWFAYDKYLRTRGVTSGVVSYSLFVQVLVGTPMDAQGLPLVRKPRT
jgi:hypothetical protein